MAVRRVVRVLEATPRTSVSQRNLAYVMRAQLRHEANSGQGMILSLSQRGSWNVLPAFSRHSRCIETLEARPVTALPQTWNRHVNVCCVMPHHLTACDLTSLYASYHIVS